MMEGGLSGEKGGGMEGEKGGVMEGEKGGGMEGEKGGGMECHGWWWSPVSGFVIVGAHHHSWVVGRSLPSMGWCCGHSSLFMLVVSPGVCIVDGGGRLWAVVKFVFVGGDVVGARCCSCWCHGGVSHGACVVAGGRLWVVVTSW